jgi:hypothetical protein
MKIRKISISVPVLALTLAVSLPSQAASVLIHRTDGQLIAEVVPQGACDFKFYIPAPGGLSSLKDAAFPMRDGTVAVNTRQYGGFYWSVTTQDGPQVGPEGKAWYVQWQFEDKEDTGKIFFGRNDNTDRTAISSKKTQEVRPGSADACVGYINLDGMRFFGNRLQDVDMITFFSKDDTATKIVQKKNKDEMARLDEWRKKITPGTDTHCGMAIEVKAPLLKVQTSIGEKWFKTAQLYPPSEKRCVFAGGVYQD